MIIFMDEKTIRKLEVVVEGNGSKLVYSHVVVVNVKLLNVNEWQY